MRWASADGALIEAHRLLGGVGLDAVEPRQLGLEIELPGQGRLGEIVAVLAEREARFLIEIGDPRAGLALLPFRRATRAASASCSVRTSSWARATWRIVSRIRLAPLARSSASTASSALAESTRRTRMKMGSGTSHTSR